MDILSVTFVDRIGYRASMIIAHFCAVAGFMVPSLMDKGEKGLTIRQLFRKKIFWVLMVMMICAGASEQAVSQWASAFAETGLHVSKTIGDLAGPMLFAFLMGSARAFYGKYGERIDLDQFMIGRGSISGTVTDRNISYTLSSVSTS